MDVTLESFRFLYLPARQGQGQVNEVLLGSRHRMSISAPLTLRVKPKVLTWLTRLYTTSSCYLSDLTLPSTALLPSAPVIGAEKEHEGFLGAEAASH